MNNFSFSPIARISSCYKEKFSIPRQANLVREAAAELVFLKPYASKDIVRGLEGFSHIWIIFAFHAVPLGRWKPMVRPPRLGGNQRLGVFATRSTHRPNPIGMSAVELVDIQVMTDDIRLVLKGCDLLDGTPVLDIKPYLPYADAIPEARGGFAPAAPSMKMSVRFTETAESACINASERLKVDIRLFIEQLLALDPRPSYQAGQVGNRIYASHVYDVNLRWRYTDVTQIEVIDLAIRDE
ncbi:MAG: tRNA (N6-threonylcarbamoyladenosine(37)-N6)-methyltransferase TrmO [Leucothrix sp.]